MNKRKKNYIIYLIGVVCVILVFAFSLILEYANYQEFKDSIIINKAEYIDRNNYRVQINYPYLKNEDINERIKNTIKKEKKEFLSKVKNSKDYDSELNINYSYTILANLYSIHLKSYYNIGKNNEHKRTDYIVYYDSVNNKKINTEDIIINNKFYEVVRNKAYEYLVSNLNISTEEINKIIVATKDNYKVLTFNKDNIQIVLNTTPTTSYTNEVNLTIQYNTVIQYLNTEYIKVDTVNEVIDTNIITKNYERIRDSKNFENKKLVAITFDDGPAYAKTDQLITELDKRDARVSFFMLGELAFKQADLVKKAYDYGHTIGSHTYDHKNLNKLKAEQIAFEIDYTNEILSNIIGEKIRFIRPPYGAYNETILANTNMAFILWNVDTLDWKYRNAEKVRDYIVGNANDGDIILLHDIHATSVEGAIMAIDILKEQGFEFVSLDEMLVYRNITLENSKAYRFFK